MSGRCRRQARSATSALRTGCLHREALVAAAGRRRRRSRASPLAHVLGDRREDGDDAARLEGVDDGGERGVEAAHQRGRASRCARGRRWRRRGRPRTRARRPATISSRGLACWRRAARAPTARGRRPWRRAARRRTAGSERVERRGSALDVGGEETTCPAAGARRAAGSLPSTVMLSPTRPNASARRPSVCPSAEDARGRGPRSRRRAAARPRATRATSTGRPAHVAVERGGLLAVGDLRPRVARAARASAPRSRASSAAWSLRTLGAAHAEYVRRVRVDARLANQDEPAPSRSPSRPPRAVAPAGGGSAWLALPAALRATTARARHRSGVRVRMLRVDRRLRLTLHQCDTRLKFSPAGAAFASAATPSETARVPIRADDTVAHAASTPCASGSQAAKPRSRHEMRTRLPAAQKASASPSQRVGARSQARGPGTTQAAPPSRWSSQARPEAAQSVTAASPRGPCGWQETSLSCSHQRLPTTSQCL